MKLTNNSQTSKNISGRRIREAREGRMGHQPKITQDQLAARLQSMGVPLDRLSICRIERGNRQVTDFELAAIAKALAVPVEWLLFGRGTSLPEIPSHPSVVADGPPSL